MPTMLQAKIAAEDAFDYIVKVRHPNRVGGWAGNAGQIFGGDVCADLAEQMIGYLFEKGAYRGLVMGRVFSRGKEHVFIYVSTPGLQSQQVCVSDPWTGKSAARAVIVSVFDGQHPFPIDGTTGSPPFTFEEDAESYRRRQPPYKKK